MDRKLVMGLVNSSANLFLLQLFQPPLSLYPLTACLWTFSSLFFDENTPPKLNLVMMKSYPYFLESVTNSILRQG